MSEDTRVGTPAPAWLYDDETGQTRWWNGAGWTDHARPLDPVVRTWTEHRPAGTSPAYAQPAPKSTRAKAWFAVLLIAVVGIGLVVLGFLAFRLATAPGAVDSAALEEQGIHRGFGLMIMRERAESAGGRLRVESTPGDGTRVVIDVET